MYTSTYIYIYISIYLWCIHVQCTHSFSCAYAYTYTYIRDSENNKTSDKSARENHLGYTKHILINREMFKPESAKILWNVEYVEVDCVMVAWISSDGEFHSSGKAGQIKCEVQTMVKEFIANRRGGSSSD